MTGISMVETYFGARCKGGATRLEAALPSGDAGYLYRRSAAPGKQREAQIPVGEFSGYHPS
jgi:hypothetical protein